VFQVEESSATGKQSYRAPEVQHFGTVHEVTAAGYDVSQPADSQGGYGSSHNPGGPGGS
jgi:hypothetical protein